MRRVLTFLLALVLFFGVASAIPMYASAQSLYVRKIVSVVYDDSGSMISDDSGKNWAYASYAMQAFCGLLNSEDQLYITYMSDVILDPYAQPVEIDLSADGIQTDVDTIRNRTENNGTAYYAIDIGFNVLKNVQDSDENTQYWLVVITDGDMSVSESALTDDLLNYCGQTMPNGTRPQITYMAIGNNATKPKENIEKGLYVEDPNGIEIVDVMSEIADRVSGRTRLESKDITMVDDNTIRVNSAVPLSNIAVLMQNTDAKVQNVKYEEGGGLVIERAVNIQYPDAYGWNTDRSLIGSTFLINNGDKNITAGGYEITFDKPVSKENFVVMYEPALELRLTITCNGEPVENYHDLNSAHAEDSISISYELYEAGTENKIDMSMLPKGTTSEIAVYEGDEMKESSSGADMNIPEYMLSQTETEIKASVNIGGFNPIEVEIHFTPQEKAIRYTLEAEYEDGIQSVKLDDLPINRQLRIVFTVLADGVPVTDPSIVKNLGAVISVSPNGNSGVTEYTDDGKIIFTPNYSDNDSMSGIFEVTVTCDIDGASASLPYSVLTADYGITPIGNDGEIRKNEFYGNDKGASFYITKDDVRMTKAEVEGSFSVYLDEKHEDLKTIVTVADDGTIKCVPFSDEANEITFGTWWINWIRYFSISGEDIVVTISHPTGEASETIPVVGAPIKYLILNVILPLFIEVIVLAAIIAYIVRYFTKARFAPNTSMYVGGIMRNRREKTHSLELREIPLAQYNTFKNLWNPFKELTVNVNGLSFTAAKRGKVICNEAFPWFCGEVIPKSRLIDIEMPIDVVRYCMDNSELEIKEILPTAVMDNQRRTISQSSSAYYCVRADITYERVAANRQLEVLDSATVFCYALKSNNA
ncbi:MAG: hypothetical protein IJC91_03370 [Oscillospiraceae bacterium]|nr:hypothetical protein [Oscillospiraceae bacterium]